MAKSKNAPYFYHQRRLDIVSGVAFFLCLGLVIWGTIEDHSREWKETQKVFHEKMQEQLTGQLDALVATFDSTALAQFEERIGVEAEKIDARGEELEGLRDQIAKIEGRLDALLLSYRGQEAILGSIQYEYELARHLKDSDVEKLAEDFGSGRRRFEELTEEKKELENELARLVNEEAALVADLSLAREAKEDLLREKKRIAEVRVNYEPSVIRTILGAPLVDFIRPSESIEQIVVNAVREDMNFVDVPTVDRCITCHLGITRPSFEGGEPPFQAHPRLDLFVGDQSPHPSNQFGCSVCHGGRGRALSFVNSAHTPRGPAQEEEWVERFGWHELKHFDSPMIPLPYVESSCLKCHQGVRYIPEASALNRGRDLFLRNGCFGCHETRGFEDIPKIGPELNGIAAKTDPVWVFNWILDPRVIHPTAVMPRFFGQSNQVSDERDFLEAAAVTSFLFSRSRREEYPQVPDGDVKSGKEFFESVGCLGCHTLGSEESTFGPNLEGIGEKTTPAWVFNWIRDPSSYSGVARMPNLRLTEQEAADVTAYLVTLKGRPLAYLEIPPVSEIALDEALVEVLSARRTQNAVIAEIAEWSHEQKLNQLGQHLITRYGCYGCHEIEEFRSYPRIGTSLSQEGSKPVGRLDLGFLGHETPMTRAGFFRQKMKDPRAFDQDRVRSPDDLLRMPNFEFDDEEIKGLVIHLMSLTDDEMPEEIRRKLDSEEAMVQKGEWLLAVKNCRGCHVIEGVGGEILRHYEDPALGPPVLLQEGRKVQPVWLNNFLRRPTVLRPWLAVRMPSFEMDDEVRHVLIDYFEAEAQETQRIVYYDPEAVSRKTHDAGREAFELLKCQSCHPTGEKTPEGTPDNWGPDLALARKRLKPNWLIDWFKSPQAIQPGTKMPDFFFDYDPDYDEFEELLPDAELLMLNVRDYLMTMDDVSLSRREEGEQR